MTDATSIGQFIEQINSQFGWHLPTSEDFPPDTVLRNLWDMQVEKKEPSPGVIYHVQTTSFYEISSQLKGNVFLKVLDADSSTEDSSKMQK